MCTIGLNHLQVSFDKLCLYADGGHEQGSGKCVCQSFFFTIGREQVIGNLINAVAVFKNVMA